MSQSKNLNPYRAVEPTPDQTPRVEEKRVQVKCSQAGQLFEARLVRAAGAQFKFKLVGFEPISSTALVEYSPSNSLFTRFVKYLSNVLNRNRPAQAPQNDTGGEVVLLGIRDIDFDNHTCPVCQSAKPASNGGTHSWIQCGHCGNIFCTYNLQLTDFSFECPWCSNRGKLSTTPKALGTPQPKLLTPARPAPKAQGPRALPAPNRPKQLPGSKP
jgi:hypothetical protein